jgi:hypothetical protein
LQFIILEINGIKITYKLLFFYANFNINGLKLISKFFIHLKQGKKKDWRVLISMRLKQEQFDLGNELFPAQETDVGGFL